MSEFSVGRMAIVGRTVLSLSFCQNIRLWAPILGYILSPSPPRDPTLPTHPFAAVARADDGRHSRHSTRRLDSAARLSATAVVMSGAAGSSVEAPVDLFLDDSSGVDDYSKSPITAEGAADDAEAAAAAELRKTGKKKKSPHSQMRTGEGEGGRRSARVAQRGGAPSPARRALQEQEQPPVAAAGAQQSASSAAAGGSESGESGRVACAMRRRGRVACVMRRL